MSSGIAQSMLADVDRQFDGLRSTTQRELSSNIAREGTNRQMQAVDLLTRLAGTQNQRLDQAFNYQSVPLNLADRGFNQAIQLLQMNNPLSLANPLGQMSQQQQGQSAGMQSALGYLAYILANGGQSGL